MRQVLQTGNTANDLEGRHEISDRLRRARMHAFKLRLGHPVERAPPFAEGRHDLIPTRRDRGDDVRHRLG
jgi:hypothetical protein